MKRLIATTERIMLQDDEGNPAPFDKLEGEFLLIPTNLSKCLSTLRPGEPIFVLRGQDASAPNIIQAWAARNSRTSPIEKVDDAIKHAGYISAWQRANPKLVKFAD